MFSCLAAHAAVLHFDGIARRPLPKKISGVFASLRAADDPLLAGVPARAATPHSRQNGLLESDLTAHNYRDPVAPDRRLGRICSRATATAASSSSRAIPNMTPTPWAANICATWRRFLRGEGARPAVPENYFDRVTENALQALAGREARSRDYNDMVTGAVPLQSWRSYTLRLFANWIACIAAEKPRRRPRAAPVHRSA